MKVIIVSEENHGNLCVAKDYKSAVRWLIDDRWIADYTEAWVNPQDQSYEYDKLINVLGEDWIDTMVEKWDIENFNDFWDGSFSMRETDLVEY